MNTTVMLYSQVMVKELHKGLKITSNEMKYKVINEKNTVGIFNSYTEI